MKLILFDIDGTMLKSEGVGRASMESALTSVFGSPGSASYRYDGKTDKQIVREVMKGDGPGDDRVCSSGPPLSPMGDCAARRNRGLALDRMAGTHSLGVIGPVSSGFSDVG